jgi:tetratricopeptide (TPR) repeat protein
MNPHLEKAFHLCRISRHGEAEKELRAALAENPQDSDSQALLGVCLSLLGRPEEAMKEAEEAVRRSPDASHCHFMRAQVLYNARRFKEALGSIGEALRLNPHDPDYFHVLSLIYYAQSEWAKALEAAEMGLKEDSEHVDCHVAQAKALMKLGRSPEAHQSVQTAVRLEPERAETMAAQGWAYLEQNKVPEAMQAFREALRIEPNMEWARQGILHAMRARNPLYGLMLKYFLWMSKKKGKFQWAFVVGAYLLMQGLRIASDKYPALDPYVMPILIAYFLFCIFSWIAVPFFNLILRLDKFGRMALNEDEIKTSNRIGGFLLACAASFALYAYLHGIFWLKLGLFYLLLLPPLAAFSGCSEPQRKKAKILIWALAAIGFGGALLAGSLGSTLWQTFIYGALVSSILISLMAARP